MYATFGQRTRGYLIDALIFLPVLIAGVVLRHQHFVTVHLANGRSRHHLVSERLPVTTTLLLGLPAMAYTISLIALQGRTLGQRALRLRVVPEAGGGPVGWGRSVRRWAVIGVPATVVNLVHVRPFGTLLSLWILVVFLWMQVDDEKRGLHDKAASVVVIRDP